MLRAILPVTVAAWFGTLTLTGGWHASSDASTFDDAGTPPDTPTLTVRNTLDGVPFITTVTPIGRAIVDGQECSTAVAAVVYDTILNETPWPIFPSPPCNSIGVPTRICYSPLFTLCSDEFVWEGSDLQVDMPWPEEPGKPKIITHFAHQGVTQPVTVLGWEFATDSRTCGGGNTPPATVPSIVSYWPAATPGCDILDMDAQISFLTEEFGILEGSFVWNREDVALEIDTGALLDTPTPSATVKATDTSTPAPAQLPEAGGTGAGGDSPPPLARAALLALCGAGLAFAGYRFGRR